MNAVYSLRMCSTAKMPVGVWPSADDSAFEGEE